jgi:hypothetical protein
MNSQDNREAIFAALEFSVVTILSLIISWISSEKEVTPVTYWLAMFFVALLTTGALIKWARKSGPRKSPPSPPTPPGPMPPHPEPPSPRTTRSVLAGAVSGLLVSVLFFLMIGPGSHGSTTAPDPSPTVTVTPGSTPPTSGPAPTASSPSSSGQLVTVHATPGGGGTQFGDDITVTVTANRPLPTGDTYWLMVQFLGGPNVVYKAEGRVPATNGTTSYSLSIASAAIGSTRRIYVLQADSEATSTLVQNYAHQEPSWDGNRTSLPSGAVMVSNSVIVVKQIG